MSEFRMPSLGADMETGTVYDWRVKPGDPVRRGDVIVTVETDKGVIDVEIFEEGVITEIMVAEGTEVPVGTVLALLNGTDKPVEPETQATVREQPERVEAHPMDQRPLVLPDRSVQREGLNRRLKVSPAAKRLAREQGIDLNSVRRTGPEGSICLADVERALIKPASSGERLRATPVARRMAEEMGLALDKIAGTGPQGTIIRADVAAVAKPTEPAPAPKVTAAVAAPGQAPKVDFQTGMRRAIAAAMSRSNRDIPHYYLESRLDMSKALNWLAGANQKRSLKERLLPVVLSIKAMARALAEVPNLNGFWRDDRFEAAEAIHIGFAVALRQGGLVTPAILHADMLTLDEIMATVRDLIQRTRSGRLRSSELMEATVTLTSLGDRGAEKVFGVIYPPQVALVGLGKTVEQPWVENGMLGIRPVLTATLAADHRASDGHSGALFLEAFDRYLQEPEKL